MCIIKRISTSGSGDKLLLLIAAPNGENKTIAVGCETYRRLGLTKGEISEATYRELIAASSYEAALTKGVRILGYGANSPRQLKNKLSRSGVSRENAEACVDELRARGYLNESADAKRLSEGLIKKGYGPKRILASLRSKGYSDEALEAVLEVFDEIDFEEACTRVAREKFKSLKNERAEVQKALAKLVNLGYNVSDAKKALETVLSEQN